MKRYLLAAAGCLVLSLVLILFITLRAPKKSSVKPFLVASLRYTAVDAITLEGFKSGLQEMGYREGDRVRYLDFGPVEEIRQLAGRAAELVGRRPDLIFVSSTPATLAIQRATQDTSIPVVFSPVNDPVGAGIVKSLVRPGGRITGIKLAAGDARRLALFKEIVPGLTTVYFPYNPEDQSALATRNRLRAVIDQLTITLVEVEVRNPAELTAQLARLPKGLDGIFLPRDSMLESQIGALTRVALKHGLPLSAPSSLQTEAGGLFSYGHNHLELGRQAARLAGQILAGIPPGDLPVENAGLYFEINLQTAARIGLQIPENVLRRADRIVR